MIAAVSRLRPLALAAVGLAFAQLLAAAPVGPRPGAPLRHMSAQGPGLAPVGPRQENIDPVLRRELAQSPRTVRAVWIDLDARAAASSLPPALSRDAIARRARYGIGVLATDRPIAPALVARLRGAGARIRVEDRWSRSVSADVDSAVVARLSRVPGVIRITPVRKLRVMAPAAPPSRGGDGNRSLSPRTPFAAVAQDSFYGLTYSVLQQLNIPAAHSLGVTGRGVRIGMLDTGFDRTHEALAPISVAAQYDFIWNDTIVSNQAQDTFPQAWHGSATLSLVGGNKPGKFVGAAYGATFLLAKTEVDNRLGIDSHQDEDRWVAGAQWLAQQGVDIISSSLGYRYDFPDGNYTCAMMNGRTTKTSITASQLHRLHILLVNAIGNDGPAACSLSAPADADSIIAAGGVDSLGQVWSGSSRGPTGDGRIKPELVARSVLVPHAVVPGLTTYGFDNGTSFATPLLAGAAALVLQAWPGISPIAVRQALILAATNVTPDNNVGYGIPDVASAIMFPQGIGISGVSPLSPLGELRSVAPTFSWVAAAVSTRRPVLYRLDVAADTGFRNMIYSDTVSGAFNLTARVPIRPTPTLYWRIVATAGPSIQRLTPVSGPFRMPHWVTLTTLNDVKGSFTDTPRPTLQWTALAVPPLLGQMHFDVQVLGPTGIPVQTMTDVTTDTVKLTQSLDYNAAYSWRVIARVGGYADTVTSVGTFVVNSAIQPPTTTLYQNFPNPFPRAGGASETRIWFDLSANVQVELNVYDLRGRLVRRLIPGPGCGNITLGPGLFGRTPVGDECIRTTWDGRDDAGRTVPRGVYLLRLRAGGVSQTRHIVFTP